jgi:homocysteine S-methyltransferase
MGTMLYAKGISLHRCFDELNLSLPHLVKEVHLDYVKSGAEVLETNTFGANRFRLAKHELAHKVREINLAGARLAREAAGDGLYVAGSVGPLGVRLEPLGPTSLEEARAAFREQIAALAAGGVDLILIETMLDLNEARQALRAARDAGPLPVIVQMTIAEDGNTPTGTPPEVFTRELDAAGADVVGLNCGVGPVAMLEALERMAAVTHKHLSVQPNAGLPRTLEGRCIYLSSPEYLAEYARQFLERGARLVGGCCGTTPAHIAAIKAVARSRRLASVRTAPPAPPPKVSALDPRPCAERSRLAAKLARGGFPVLVEILPPKGSDPTREVEGARYLADQGVDAVNIPDGAGMAAHMSALTLAAILQQQAGIETVLHYRARGRRVPDIQADLLGAGALGIANILAVTGYPFQFATYPGVSDVLEVDAIGLVNILNNLNRGLDAGSNPLGTQTGFLVGVALNPQALDADEERRRFAHKLEAGADFAVTPPIFDVGHLARFLERLGPRRIPILAGIWPLTSLRNAEYLNNEVPGVAVPAAVMERMRAASGGDRARAEGLKIAQEILRELRGLVQGVQIAAPFGRVALAAEVAAVLREVEPPPVFRDSHRDLQSKTSTR